MKIGVSYLAFKNDHFTQYLNSWFKALKIKYRIQNIIVHVTIFSHAIHRLCDRKSPTETSSISDKTVGKYRYKFDLQI